MADRARRAAAEAAAIRRVIGNLPISKGVAMEMTIRSSLASVR
jgi:hypothetical protein